MEDVERLARLMLKSLDHAAMVHYEKDEKEPLWNDLKDIERATLLHAAQLMLDSGEIAFITPPPASAD